MKLVGKRKIFAYFIFIITSTMSAAFLNSVDYAVFMKWFCICTLGFFAGNGVEHIHDAIKKRASGEIEGR